MGIEDGWHFIPFFLLPLLIGSGQLIINHLQSTAKKPQKSQLTTWIARKYLIFTILCQLTYANSCLSIARNLFDFSLHFCIVFLLLESLARSYQDFFDRNKVEKVNRFWISFCGKHRKIQRTINVVLINLAAWEDWFGVRNSYPDTSVESFLKQKKKKRKEIVMLIGFH